MRQNPGARWLEHAEQRLAFRMAVHEAVQHVLAEVPVALRGLKGGGSPDLLQGKQWLKSLDPAQEQQVRSFGSREVGVVFGPGYPSAAVVLVPHVSGLPAGNIRDAGCSYYCSDGFSGVDDDEGSGVHGGALPADLCGFGSVQDCVCVARAD
jgi:hypothetical protein